jgi:hypothetical protein
MEGLAHGRQASRIDANLRVLDLTLVTADARLMRAGDFAVLANR